MIKAIRVHKTGEPDVMVLEDVALPPPGPGEIRIKQAAIGINFIDVYFRTGQYPTALPYTPGNEGAGTVVSLGEGVKGFKAGDRVAYVAMAGSYAQECNVPASAVVKLPKEISFDIAAALMLKGLTCEYLLFRSFKLKKGHVALIHAAAGGVGQILCQWARALGATVIGTVGTDEKVKIAKKVGCHHVIQYNKEDFVQRVSEITKGGKCHVVYDGVGKSTFPASLDCLKPLGVLVSFGSASGQIDAFNVGVLAQKGSLFITRPTLATFTADRKTHDKMAKRLFKAVADKLFKVPASTKYPLSEAVQAHRDLQSRATTGSMILKP